MKNPVGKWSAIYLPMLPDNSKRPDMHGFASKEEAWEYIFSQMCNTCVAERNMALLGFTDYNEEKGLHPNLYPGCACEWEAVRTEELI